MGPSWDSSDALTATVEDRVAHQESVSRLIVLFRLGPPTVNQSSEHAHAHAAKGEYSSRDAEH